MERKETMAKSLITTISLTINEPKPMAVVITVKKVGINFSPNQNALEIGSSPGGATYALLKQNLK